MIQTVVQRRCTSSSSGRTTGERPELGSHVRARERAVSPRAVSQVNAATAAAASAARRSGGRCAATDGRVHLWACVRQSIR